MSRSVLDDLNENWAAWLDFTAEHATSGASRTFGAVRCSSVGVPMPLFNQAFVFDEPAADDLASATSWLSARNVPFWVTAPDATAGAVAGMAESAGLDSSAATTPGMAFAPLADLPAEATHDVEMLQVTDGAQLTDFAIVAAEAFGRRWTPQAPSPRRPRSPTTAAPGSSGTSMASRPHAASCFAPRMSLARTRSACASGSGGADSGLRSPRGCSSPAETWAARSACYRPAPWVGPSAGSYSGSG